MLHELRDAQISAAFEVLCFIVDLRVQGWSRGLKFHTTVATTYKKFNQFDQYTLDLCTAPFCASFAA
jgi:hypothetical protein